MKHRLLVLAAHLAISAGAPMPSHAADSAPPLAARLEALRPELARSPFGRPLVLRANDSDTAPQGDVYAIIDRPIGAVSAALQTPAHWCEVLMLQTNVKRCAAGQGANGSTLEVGIARRYTDPVDSAQSITFDWQVRDARPEHLSVALSAPQGPLGTHNYRLRFEAVPAGEGRSFVHLSYAYETAATARWATNVYLATSGRDKVGFTVTGRDEQGRPRYGGGMQGVAERNTMRYFLAIESQVDSLALPPAERAERRWRSFHAALERYPAQLHETGLQEYLALKRREAGAS
ncbi:hypothetical protein [Ideonella sp. BN130291]|uniref:hypothetical protein n=1 Tax=Ideonella sp. BN130291 TaxID=3112940 RepID=UPI002E25EEE3|nr:hypothetical protein [Ideonella sp. BN130291]